MTFLDRPDRILKALPFIVGKATWDAAGRANNASHSYPFLLWRTMPPPGAAHPENTPAKTEPTSADSAEWMGAVFVETHLHKWYAAFADLDGDRFVLLTWACFGPPLVFISFVLCPHTHDACRFRHGVRVCRMLNMRACNPIFGACFAASQIVRSDTADLQVHGFCSSANQTDGNATTLTLVINNLAFARGSNRTVALSWPAAMAATTSSASVIDVKRLYWDETTATPQLDVANSVGGTAVPSQLELRPAELVVLRVSTGSARFGADVDATPSAAAGRTINEQTVYPDRLLQPMASSEAAAAPYMFRLPASTTPAGTTTRAGTTPADASSMRVRVGFGGSAASTADSKAAFARTVASMAIKVGGVACKVDPVRQIAGPLHVNAKDFTYFTSIEVEAPSAISAAPEKVEVLVWSAAADNSTVVSTVVLTVLTTVTHSSLPRQLDVRTG